MISLSKLLLGIEALPAGKRRKILSAALGEKIIRRAVRYR
jgi:hypothetical protein